MPRDGALGGVGVACGDRLRQRLVVGSDPRAGGRPVGHLAERGPHALGDRLAQRLHQQRRERVAGGPGELHVEAGVELQEAVAVLTPPIAAASSREPVAGAPLGGGARGHRLDRHAQVDEVRQRDLHSSV